MTSIVIWLSIYLKFSKLLSCAQTIKITKPKNCLTKNDAKLVQQQFVEQVHWIEFIYLSFFWNICSILAAYYRVSWQKPNLSLTYNFNPYHVNFIVMFIWVICCVLPIWKTSDYLFPSVIHCTSPSSLSYLISSCLFKSSSQTRINIPSTHQSTACLEWSQREIGDRNK